MAEFKLGRIRFVWKGVWSTPTQYYVDDVVKHGGQIYICTVGHVSATDFNTDLEASTTRWNLMSGGQDWKNNWATGVLYKLNDLVKYGGSVYICVDSHTSAATETLGLEQDLNKWHTFAEGFDWKNDWTVSTRYKINDLVKYGGYTYVCTTGHTSAATETLGLEPDLANWNAFNEGTVYKGVWASTTRYKSNDVVKYGAGLWICTTPHTSTSTFSTSNFAQFVEGFEFESTWSNATTYQPGDIVGYGGNQYVAKTVHSNVAPTTLTTGAINWDLYSQGFKFQSDWSNATSYKIGEVVRLNGYTYVATADSVTETYSITATTAGSKTFTTADTTNLVSGKSIRFTGTTFGNVFTGATYYVKTIVGPSTFTVSATPGGADFTPTTASGTMTATVAAMPTNASYWTRLNSGIRWQGAWVDDNEYVLGDAVRYGVNTYICVLGHRSEADDGSTVGATGGGQVNSRPDQDLTGTYWNALTLGSETAVLTTQGDMVYYSGSGPVRLPIGTSGQVLQVNTNNEPEWAYLWQTDHVYYVAPHGANSPFPVQGATLQNPWGSIRYACEQIEKGCRNPNAQRLLELNRAFIQREVSEWIQYQITNNAVPFTTLFDYDEYKCERDVGLVIDALMYDLGHGGNVKTRGAALAYVNSLSDSPGTYTKLATEKEEDVAAYNYMVTLIGSVLSNVAPASNYQVLNGDNSTAVVTQDFTEDNAEVGALAQITSLVGIINAAITAGVDTDIPARNAPSNVVHVKTGVYAETLPIVVPAETCLLGDEVRGVHVGPAGSLISKTDVQYSVAAVGRMNQIVGDIILGNNVTETTGNTAIQSRDFPFASSVEVAQVNRLTRALQYSIDFNIGTTNKAVSAEPTDYNTSYLTGYGLARTLVTANKEFLKQQVKAYITANYPTLKYSRTACLRDVGYIVDALAYDLTYGGNAMSVQAGLAYYEGVGSSFIVNSTEKVATLASYAYLKSMVQTIVVDGTVTPLQVVEAQVHGTAAPAGTATFLGANLDEMIDIVDNGPSAATLTDPSTSWVASALTTASSTLSSASTTIATDTITFINTTYPALVGNYNTTKCSRDVETILKAVRYDFMFNSNFQSLKAAYSYLRATATEIYSLGQKTATRGALEYVRTQAIANVGGNTTAISRINTLFQAIDDILFSGSTEGSVCATEVRAADYAILQLERNRDYIISEVSAWMNYNYVNFSSYYNATTCARDIRYIVDAVISDLATGSNFASSVAGESYYRIQAALVPAAQMMQTVAAVKEAKRLAQGYVTHSSQYTAVNAAFENVLTILQGGLTAVPAYTWPDNGTATATDVSDAAALQTNRATMITGIETYLSSTAPYSTVWAALTTDQKNTCKRDVGYIIDAVTYDLQYGGDYQSTVAGSAYYSFGTLEIAVGEKAATLAALTQLGTLMKAYTSAGGDTKVDAKIAVVYGIVNTGATEPMTYTLPSVAGEGANTIATHAAILAGKTTIATGVTTYITATFDSYTYDITMCERDVGAFIDALKFDLKYPGNYKTLSASRYYANAVIGSLEEDMFLLRNGTGVRNMTLEGLTGDLTPENAYGTRRVTAGAYASLDPGWGPDDFRTWIISRSPYVQNCCTFGYGAIGQKIDGSLHTGGYKSMVSNDFTQLISDGIGAWVTNNGRAELVSVFTYYSHIGYLSENGGRIRGTNGNNSYGDFGSVAEGYDATETPITAVVDNRAYKATVGSVFTDQAQDVLAFEFDNAGSEYTAATWQITGAGLGAVAEATEFRDDAVFQVRLLDNVDDSTSAPEAAGNFGGFGYVSNANTAQTGNATSITIAATDSEISSAYVGMKIYLTGGTGVGQYGIIDTYNAGTKTAAIIKESTGTSGWDHVVPGTTIVSPDASTTYIIEPRLSFSAPTYSAATASYTAASTWLAHAYAEVHKVYTTVTGATSGSGVSASFNLVRTGTKYKNIDIHAAGTGYAMADTITILGTSLGGATPANDLVITVLSVNSLTGAIQAVEIDGRAQGGRFVSVRYGDTATGVSIDGATWSAGGTLPTGNWAGLASGPLTAVETAGSFVVGRSYRITDLGDTSFTSIGARTNTIGQIFVATGIGSGSGTATPIQSVIVAIKEASNATAYSTDGGLTWATGGNLPTSGTWDGIAYGKGRWIAVRQGSTQSAYSTNGGITWTNGGVLPASANWFTVSYGLGLFVASTQGAANVAWSTDGTTWTAGTGLTQAMTRLTFGKNMFVGVSGNTTYHYSLDGKTWISGTLPSSLSYIGYGQGVFLGVPSGSTSAVYSSEDGLTWTSRAVATSSYGTPVFGNPNNVGTWNVPPVSGQQQSQKLTLGCTARARAYVSEEKIFAIRITEPGSSYASAPTMTITDPNNIYEAPFTVRTGKGALATPSFADRGTGFVSAQADIDTGDGYADYFQDGAYVGVKHLTARPVPGSNVTFGNLPGQTFKLVNVLTFLGQYEGSYTAFFQISPQMKKINAPAHNQSVTTRIRYSQVRLTGHDFLDIGTGNFDETNYPGIPTQVAIQGNETVEGNSGRVFFTSTDQDGNFRVGDLFTIEQSTGVATLNADAFNIAGLQELTLGEVSLGGGSASITEFSTDPYFTANSDSIVPTQRAIKAYISSQIGGGGAALNVNSVTAGSIYIAVNEITTIGTSSIKVNAKMNFTGGVTGTPLAFNYFIL